MDPPDDREADHIVNEGRLRPGDLELLPRREHQATVRGGPGVAATPCRGDERKGHQTYDFGDFGIQSDRRRKAHPVTARFHVMPYLVPIHPDVVYAHSD